MHPKGAFRRKIEDRVQQPHLNLGCSFTCRVELSTPDE